MRPGVSVRSSSKEIRGAYMDENTFFTHVVPQKYQDATIDSLDKQPESLKEFGREWAKNPVSLFLYGNKGSGKTRYAFAIVREMFRRSSRIIWPRYFTSPELDSRLHDALMTGGDRELVQNLSREDLLLIDDFGRETKSDRIRRQYFEIINYRYSNELPTILTSNYDLDTLGQNLDEVISSRIEEWQHIRFTGPDLRKKELVV